MNEEKKKKRTGSKSIGILLYEVDADRNRKLGMLMYDLIKYLNLNLD